MDDIEQTTDTEQEALMQGRLEHEEDMRMNVHTFIGASQGRMTEHEYYLWCSIHSALEALASYYAVKGFTIWRH